MPSKYINVSRLSKKEQNNLFAEFAKALSCVKSPTEAANLIRNLYSEQEALMLAKRLKIAELLNQGFSYQDIKRMVKTSDGTIAKIQAWLRLYGDGCRALFKRSKKLKIDHPEELKVSWRQYKKKYPVYYWPELLLDEIIKSASRREKEKLLRVINGMREKTKLTKQLLTILA